MCGGVCVWGRVCVSEGVCERGVCVWEGVCVCVGVRGCGEEGVWGRERNDTSR